MALGVVFTWAAAGTGPLLAQTNLLDTNFNVGTGVTGQVGSFGQFVHALALDSDGRILLGGNFTRVQSVSRSCVARLLSDGTLDTSFDPGAGANNEVLAVACQPDGKVLLGGLFTRVNGTNYNRLARLNGDGTLDPSFQIGTGASDNVRDIALQPDGKILIAGQFARFNGTVRSCVARLDTNGQLDPSFDPGLGVGGVRFLDAIRVLSDGRILISGDFNSYNGTPRASIARLHPDGSLDPSFDPGLGAKPDDPILALALQADGKIVIAGSFTSFNRKPWKNIGRLLPDGQPDPGFDPGAGVTGGFNLVHSVALDAGGNILVGGWFDRVDGCPRPNLARLLPSGRPDTNWNVRVDGQVRALALQADRKVVLGGTFTRVSGASRGGIARIHSGRIVEGCFRSCRRIGSAVELEFMGNTPNHYQIETTMDLQVWAPWTNVVGGSPVQLTDLYAVAGSHRFYRAWRLP